MNTKKGKIYFDITWGNCCFLIPGAIYSLKDDKFEFVWNQSEWPNVGTVPAGREFIPFSLALEQESFFWAGMQHPPPVYDPSKRSLVKRYCLYFEWAMIGIEPRTLRFICPYRPTMHLLMLSKQQYLAKEICRTTIDLYSIQNPNSTSWIHFTDYSFQNSQ